MQRNATLAHDWYYAGPEEHGESSGMKFQNGTIYSYGEHWPIAHKLNGSRAIILFQSKNYGSISTSAHTSHVRSAIDRVASSTIVPLPLSTDLIRAIETLSTLAPGRRMNVSAFADLFATLHNDIRDAYEKVTDTALKMNKVQRLRAEHALTQAIDEWDRVRDFLSRFGLYPLLARKWPVRDKDDWQGQTWRRVANTLRATIRNAARLMEKAEAYFKEREQVTGDTFAGRWRDYNAGLDARREQNRARRGERSWLEECTEGVRYTDAEMQAMVAEWRAGGRNDLPVGAPICLRLVKQGSIVETSMGVVLPARALRALAPLVLAAMNNNGEVKRWSELRTAVARAFAHTSYPVHHVGMDHWVIGCHTIPSSEIVLLAQTFTAEEAHHAA